MHVNHWVHCVNIINSFYAEFALGNIKIYFLLFFNTEMVQLVEIFISDRLGSIYPA